MIRLISFEGGDGSGKTTQIKLLEAYLSARGQACLPTREPGGTPLGRMIRQALLEVGEKEISPPTELFLYLADRAQHVQEVIHPALKNGRIVLCDRFTDSTLAYQGYGRRVDLDMLRRLNQVASRGITPDLTLAHLLKRHELTYRTLVDLTGEPGIKDEEIIQAIEITVKYDGYVRRQLQQVASFKKLEERRIPATFEYDAVIGFSREVLEKLKRVRPASIGQASRISGITPAAVSLLLVVLERERRQGHSPIPT